MKREIIGIVCSNCIYDGISITIKAAEMFSSILEANKEGTEDGSEMVPSEQW